MLNDAKALFAGSAFGSAVDRAYYCMFHAAHAALAVKGVTGARSHRGLRSQFGQHLVLPGIIERRFARDLTFAHQLRQESSYEAYASVSSEEAKQAITRAEEFLGRMQRLVSEAWS